MTHNPQVADFLKILNGANSPEICDVGPLQARKNSYLDPDAAGQIDSRVQIKHRFFTSPTADLPLRIYLPSGDGPFRALVYFHGGGWVVNNIGMYDAPLTVLAQATNSVVISVNYQKAPENPFPIPFDDCFAGLQWVIENCKELNVNQNAIGIGGDSAGGNLASAVALKARDSGLGPLAYQLLIYPCNGPEYVMRDDVPNSTGQGLTQRTMKWLWDQYLGSSADLQNPYAVPHSATEYSGLPSTILITAEYDVLRLDGIDYGKKLKSAGNDLTYEDFGGMIHGFFSLGKYFSQTKVLLDFIAKKINERFAIKEP